MLQPQIDHHHLAIFRRVSYDTPLRISIIKTDAKANEPTAQELTQVLILSVQSHLMHLWC